MFVTSSYHFDFPIYKQQLNANVYRPGTIAWPFSGEVRAHTKKDSHDDKITYGMKHRDGIYATWTDVSMVNWAEIKMGFWL